MLQPHVSLVTVTGEPHWDGQREWTALSDWPNLSLRSAFRHFFSDQAADRGRAVRCNYRRSRLLADHSELSSRLLTQGAELDPNLVNPFIPTKRKQIGGRQKINIYIYKRQKPGAGQGSTLRVCGLVCHSVLSWQNEGHFRECGECGV